MSNSLPPHGLQYTRFPSPSLSPGVCSNSCSLGWLCYLTISCSATSFSFCHQSFPASGSFPLSQFSSGGHGIGASASTSVLPMNIQGSSLWSPRDSEEFSPASQFESTNYSVCSLLYDTTLTFVHDYWKNIALTIYRPLPAK